VGVDNLCALEIETAATVEKYRENTRGKILDFLKYADIPIDPSPFVEAATTIQLLKSRHVRQRRRCYTCEQIRLLCVRYCPCGAHIPPAWHEQDVRYVAVQDDKKQEETMSLKKSLSFKKEKKEVKDR